MKCAKCQGKVIRAQLNSRLDYYGEEKKKPGCAIYQECYSPIIAYACENCGYMELYYKEPEELEND